ncbi:MAG: hypothetical protein AAF383_27765, partial [Cyanobacteria bacterium P01_A01_bin.83]
QSCISTSLLPPQNSLPRKVILLEPSALKVARSVLRGERDSDVSALPDSYFYRLLWAIALIPPRI